MKKHKRKSSRVLSVMVSEMVANHADKEARLERRKLKKAEDRKREMDLRMKKMERKYPNLSAKYNDLIEQENGSSIMNAPVVEMTQRTAHDRRQVDDSLYALAYEERRIEERRSCKDA